MRKTLRHRFSRLLRLAVVWGLIVSDAQAPWPMGNAYAQDNDVMMLGVTPFSTKAPASIVDLMASPNPSVQGQISLTWTAPQGNAGGTPINNQAVAAYIVQYATFSVASLAGDTTSWWNATSTSTTLLQPQAYMPKQPGQMELYAISGLTPGTTYYFGVKSISQYGITSPIDSESASPNSQASAVAAQLFVTTGASPMQPTGLSTSFFGGQFTLNWHAVTLDVNQQSISIDHYLLYRYDEIGSSPTVTATVPSNKTSYIDTVGSGVYFYRIFAVAVGGAISAASDYVDSSSLANHYYIAPDDINTRVVVPDALAQELNSEHNVYGEDLEIELTRRQQDEVDVTLRSYHIGAYKAVSGVEIPFFAFSESGMQVQLGLGASLSAGRLSSYQVGQIRQASAGGNTTAGSIAQIVSVYWYNGSSYLRISDPTLTSNEALSVNVRNMGTYQIRATQIATQFQLTQGSPYPRVITPNDPSQNNRVFWFFDNPSGDPVTGTIYDIRGAKVCDIAMGAMSPTSNSLVWNGRDSRGAVVPSGVYLYKITTGNQSQTGTVVVAR